MSKMISKRLLSLMLALVMMFSLLPMQVLAVDEAVTSPAVVDTQSDQIDDQTVTPSPSTSPVVDEDLNAQDEGDATQPEGSEGDATQPEGGEGDATQPEGGEGDATQPEGGEGDATQPEGGEGDATQPEGGEGDATQPEGGEGDATQPEDGEGDATQPEDGEGDATQPEGGEGDATQPEDGEGDATQPEDGEGDVTEPEQEEDAEASEEEEKEEAKEEQKIYDDDSVQIVTLFDGRLYADNGSKAGITVDVGRSQVTLQITGVGTGGEAQLYRYSADSYYTGDTLTGISKNVNTDGELLVDYTCGTSAVVTFNRYKVDGSDNLYAKYYLVQDGEILAGPVYAEEIASLRSVGPFAVKTKKGLTLEDASTIDTAIEIGASNTVINMDVCDLIFANEDANGNPIDNSKRGDVIEFESNGKMYYFNADYVAAQDRLISAYSRNGMNVTLVLIAWAKTYTKSYPSALLYLDASQNRQTMAFNTSTELGRGYWIAAMEFMANRYSQNSSLGVVNKFIVGNEIDYTYDWYLIQPLKDANGQYQRADFDTFMEEYTRTLRLANLAIKKYNSNAKVLVSLTHNWAMNCYDSYNNKGNTIRYNSYAPKAMLDWINVYEKGRGDYDWGLSVHPYPIGTTSSNPIKTDPAFTGKNGQAYPITGDMNSSPWITAANLELYQLYLQQPKLQYKGQIRSVSITETSICNKSESAGAEAYQQSINEQAASIAQYYYRAACIDCIEEIAYFQLHDQPSYMLGLIESDGTLKPSFNVWKYVDTNRSFMVANRYLKYIDANAKSYKEVMAAVKSDFNWDVMWDEDKIMVRDLAVSDAERTITSDKDTYGANEPILVTATGDATDLVGLYLASDDPASDDPIYSYYVSGKQNRVQFKSGKTYDIIAYGNITTGRVGDAKLKAGDYQLALIRSDNGEILTKNITISADYSFGSTTHSLAVNKDVFKSGEDIIVTATGNTNCWVGIYGANDRYGTGATTSIYWYYINDEANGMISGKPTIIQSTIHNSDSSNPSERIAAGEYTIYLFDGSNGNDYNVVAKKNITIEPVELQNLKSISYVLDNETDGFANGYVTIEKDEENDDAVDCVMYWADADGKPLEGYTSLGKFKLDDTKTVHKMTTHTVIPAGAKKLIAYASDGSALSNGYVSVDLPANCTYDLSEKPNVEFQIISDVHVTTDSGATGEVKLANKHFSQMLEDVKKNSPDSIGIFINGDIANTGSNAEYQKVYSLYQAAKNAGNGNLPFIHMSIGNHDWMAGNPNGQFQKYCAVFNESLKSMPEKVYYDEEINGYHFIYLGGEQAGLRAVLSPEQIQWFDTRMAEITEEDPDKPVFVFLHQSFYNTVSGSLPGQGWDGVVNEASLKRVMKKYGQIILLNGHSHWEMNSESCMFPGSEELPAALNTASVGYLWTSYDVLGGEFEEGSHGYYVRVYDDKVVFLGRSIEDGLYIPSAIFVLQRDEIKTEQEVYNITLDGEALNLEASSASGGKVTYTSTNSDIASVTEDGTVIAKQEGDVVITITSYGNDTTIISRRNIQVRIGDASVYRIYGADRYETAFKNADTLKEVLGVDKFDSVIIASGTGFADALAGSYLAAVKKAPILMCNTKSEADVKTYIKENLKSGGTVYVLGGTAALPTSVTSGLSDCVVRRLSGADRYATNLKILEAAGEKMDEILVCTGLDFADSLSASATGKPILLVKDKLNDDQKAFIKSANCNFTIIGGEKAVNKELEEELKEYGSVTRISGSDRNETSVLLADKYFDNPASAVVAYSRNFPDGLSGGPLAYAMKAPLVLTEDKSVAYAQKYFSKAGINRGFVLGGAKLVSDKSVRTIFGLGDTTTIVPK